MLKYMIAISVVFAFVIALAFTLYPEESTSTVPDLAQKSVSEKKDDTKVFDDSIAAGQVFERETNGSTENPDEPKKTTDVAKDATDEGGGPDEHKSVELPPIPAGSAPWFTGSFSDPIPAGTWLSPFHSPRFNPKKNLHYPHAGVDLKCTVGDPVFAVGGGMIRRVQNGERSGTTVYLDHGINSRGKRIMTVYMHLASTSVKADNQVTAGQHIATCGDTGNAKGDPQLHFELVVDGENVDPCTELACPDYLIRGQQKLAMK
jgi:murein DD-endopeptidase MepM/ murein hydrolase activator NlpD